MKFAYKVIKDTITDSTAQKHITYGIELIGSTGIPIKSIPNIFLDKGTAEHTVSLFNNAELSPEHFDDAVEDAVIEMYSI